MPLEKSTANRIALALIGLLVGIFQYTVFQSTEEIGEAPVFRLLAMATVALYSAYLVYAWDKKDLKRLLPATAVLTLAYVLPLWWVLSNLSGGDESIGSVSRGAIWCICAGLSWYVLLPFLGIYKTTGGFQFDYEKLFEYSWNNLFVTLIAGFVAGLIWLLLGILAGLFSILSVDFFSDLFFTTTFFWVATPPMFTFGVALSRENDKIIKAMRRITLTIFKALFPVLISVLFLFLAALPILGLDTLLDTNSASILLFLLVALGHLFLNSVFQDGAGEPPYSPWLLKAVNLFLLCLPLISGIAVYSLWLRIDQYGLTIPRYLGAFSLYVVLVYALGYAYAAGMELAGKNERWLQPVPRANTAMAVKLSVLFILLCTPLLDPTHWSARSQYSRLMDGRTTPGAFDHQHMETLGTVGEEYLQRILSDTRPDFAELQKDIARYRETEAAIRSDDEQDGSPSSGEERELAVTDISILTSDGEMPAGLFAQIKEDVSFFGGDSVCIASKRCTLFTADVDDDGDDEYFFSYEESVHDLYYYDKAPFGKWEDGAHFRLDTDSSAPSGLRVQEAVKNGEVNVVPPEVRDLEIGGVRFTPRR
jgi:hypothetical protein